MAARTPPSFSLKPMFSSAASCGAEWPSQPSCQAEQAQVGLHFVRISDARPDFGRTPAKFGRFVGPIADQEKVTGCCKAAARRDKYSRRGDQLGAERDHVARPLLDVEQRITARTEVLDQMDQRNFRRIVGPREHRLARKEPLGGHPVEPTHQLVTPPGLEGVGVTGLVQGHVRVLQLGGDPGARALGSGGAAGLDHPREGPVDGDGIGAASDHLGQAAGHVQLVQLQDRPGIRRKPGHGHVFGDRPGEDATLVGEEQPLDGEVTADRHQAVPVGFGRGRELEASSQDRDHGPSLLRLPVPRKPGPAPRRRDGPPGPKWPRGPRPGSGDRRSPRGASSCPARSARSPPPVRRPPFRRR